MRMTLCLAWLAATIALAACESGGSTPKATAPAGGAPSRSSGAGLTIVAKNALFERTELTARAGTLNVTVVNEDAGDVHNVHFFRGDSADAASAGMTLVANGPSTETVTLTLTAGSYFFHCDVHPALMHGTLTAR